MAPYSPPTAGRAGRLRLDFNENTVGCSPRVAEVIRQKVTESQLSIYPEYVEARAALTRFFGVEDEEMLLTNGTDEAIQVMINTFVNDDDEVLILKPAYAMYRFYSEVAGAKVKEIDYCKGTLEFPLEALLRSINDKTRAICIANPNNPTGGAVDLDVVQQVLEAAPQAAVLIDEAYYEFCGISALPLLPEHPNLFVSRTFSKVYGLAAMRFGCLFSQPANASFMRKAQSPYSVNTVAAIAAAAAIEDTDYVAKYVGEALAAREALRVGLEQLGIRYWPSQANFILFDAGARSIEVRDKLREAGVLVRDRSYEIPGGVRVTCGTREQIAVFLEQLEKIW
jgi:histidinol-phosphate aminotransferase